MTGTLTLWEGFRGARAARAGERRMVQWAVQALLPWILTLVHPSVWSLASATAQVLLGGSLLLASVARLRLVAWGSVVVAVAGNAIDPSDLIGGLARMAGSGLESALLIAAVTLLLGAWRSRAPQHVSR